MTANEIREGYAHSSYDKTHLTIHSNVMVPCTESGVIRAARSIPVFITSWEERTYTMRELDAIRNSAAEMVEYAMNKYHGGAVKDVAARFTEYGMDVHVDIEPPAGCIYTGLCIEVQTARNPGPIWSSTGMHFRAKVKGTKSKTCAKSTWRIVSGGDYMKEVKA